MKARNVKTEFYKEIEDEAEAVGLTISDLAKMTGIPRQTFAWYRNNQPLAITNYRKIKAAINLKRSNPETNDNA